MSGTRAGGLKVAITNKKKYGEDYYRDIGRKGGAAHHPNKGFGSMPRELRQKYGRLGGAISRKKVKKGNRDEKQDN